MISNESALHFLTAESICIKYVGFLNLLFLTFLDLFHISGPVFYKNC